MSYPHGPRRRLAPTAGSLCAKTPCLIPFIVFTAIIRILPVFVKEKFPPFFCRQPGKRFPGLSSVLLPWRALVPGASRFFIPAYKRKTVFRYVFHKQRHAREEKEPKRAQAAGFPYAERERARRSQRPAEAGFWRRRAKHPPGGMVFRRGMFRIEIVA